MTEIDEQRIKAPHPRRMYSLVRVLKGLKAIIWGPTASRRRVAQELVRIFSAKVGGQIIGDDYKIWVKDQEFIDRFKRLSPHNYFSMERKYLLREVARSVADLEGDVAEAGTYVGVSAWFIASELQTCDICLFDSFEGLSSPSTIDAPPNGVVEWEAGHFSGSENMLRENLKNFSNIKVYKGWIPSRFPEVSDKRFKLIHIDVDLYQPTIDSLRFFYPMVVPGGIFIFDDYGYLNCPGAFAAVNEFFEDKPEKVIHLPTGQGMVIKRSAV